MLRTVNADGDTTKYGQNGTLLNGKFIEPGWLFYVTFDINNGSGQHTVVAFLDSLAKDANRTSFYIDGEYREARMAMARVTRASEIGIVNNDTAPEWMQPSSVARQIMLSYNGYTFHLGNRRNAVDTQYSGSFELHRVDPATLDIAFSDDWQTVTVIQNTDKGVDTAAV
jgi:hypothetical protein